MPTDFDWKSWKKRQREPEPPPPEPKVHGVIEWMANGLLYALIIGSLVYVWVINNDLENATKIAHICNVQKGVAIRTIRGDAVCVKADVLTDVLTAKMPNRAE